MVQGGSDTSGGLSRGEGTNLAALVAYQPGSVVSRTILEGKAGTVTLFAFDQGEGLSEHTAPFDALVYILEGEAAVTVVGVDSRLGPGDGIVLPARKPHSLRAIKKFKMLLTMIRSV